MTLPATINNCINIVNHDKTKKKHLSIAIPLPRNDATTSPRTYQETREEINSSREESSWSYSRREDPSRESRRGNSTRVIPSQRRNALKDNSYKNSWRNEASDNNKRRTTNDTRQTKSNHHKSDSVTILPTPNAPISTATTRSNDTTTFSVDSKATSNTIQYER